MPGEWGTITITNDATTGTIVMSVDGTTVAALSKAVAKEKETIIQVITLTLEAYIQSVCK